MDAVSRIPAHRPAGLVEAGVSFDALGGAVGAVGGTDTAFPWRHALATVQHTATYADPKAATQPFDRIVQGTRTALAPWTGTSAYVNYADPNQPDYPTACWGANLARLRGVKKTYDPAGVFFNHGLST